MRNKASALQNRILTYMSTKTKTTKKTKLLTAD